MNNIFLKKRSRWINGVIMMTFICGMVILISNAWAISGKKSEFFRRKIVYPVVESSDANLINKKKLASFLLGDISWKEDEIFTDDALQLINKIQKNEVSYGEKMEIRNYFSKEINRDIMRKISKEVYEEHIDYFPDEFLNGMYLKRSSEFQDKLDEKLGWIPQEKYEKIKKKQAGEMKKFKKNIRNELENSMRAQLAWENFIHFFYSIIIGFCGFKISRYFNIQKYLSWFTGPYWIFQLKITVIYMLVVNIFLIRWYYRLLKEII